MVFLKDLDPDGTYFVRLVPEGEKVVSAMGRQLIDEGFRVEIPEKYGRRIYEIGMAH